MESDYEQIRTGNLQIRVDNGKRQNALQSGSRHR